MMILPFYPLMVSIMLGSFAAAFARGLVDGRDDGSEVSRSTRMNLERRENGCQLKLTLWIFSVVCGRMHPTSLPGFPIPPSY